MENLKSDLASRMPSGVALVVNGVVFIKFDEVIQWYPEIKTHELDENDETAVLFEEAVAPSADTALAASAADWVVPL